MKLSKGVLYYIGAIVISVLFAGLIVGCYFLVHFSIGIGWPSNYSSILVSAIALFIFIPVREYATRLWEAKVLDKDIDLETNMGYFLRLLAKNSTLDELLHSLFPRILNRFMMPGGLFGILDHSGKSYTLYYCVQGKTKKVPRVAIKAKDQFIRILSNRLIATGQIAGELQIPAIRNRLLKTNSKYYVSLPYRGKLIGFWALPNAVVKKEGKDLIKLFAIKAALILYNAHLQPSVRKGEAIQQDFIVAEKIQSFLKRSPIPRYEKFDVRFRQEATAYLEFISPLEFVYVRNLAKVTSGIYLATSIGLIHAGRELEVKNIAKFIHRNLEEDFRDINPISCLHVKLDLNSARGEDAMRGEVNYFGSEIEIKMDGSAAGLSEGLNQTKLQAADEVIFSCGGKVFLEVRKKKK